MKSLIIILLAQLTASIGHAGSLEYEPTVAKINALTDYVEAVKVLDDDDNIDKLAFTPEYKHKFYETYFQLRTHARFANSVFVWCAPLTGPFVMITMAAAGQPWWLAHKGTEGFLSKSLEDIAKDAQEKLEMTKSSNQEELSALYQAGVFRAQMNRLTNKSNMLKKKRA